MDSVKTTQAREFGSDKASAKLLDSRTLNRALLARQMLLRRVNLPAVE